MSSNVCRYFVGVDVGVNSIGFAAVQVDQNDIPMRSLNHSVLRHDAGVDPSARKTSQTRKAVSGVARRARRRLRRQRQRLAKVDQFLKQNGFPIIDLQSIADPYAPWRARAALVTEAISDDSTMRRCFSIAIRHLARHRGWRSPWSKTRSLFADSEYSDFYDAFLTRAEQALCQTIPGTPEIPVVVNELINMDAPRLRGEGGLLGGKFMQSDNVKELRKIFEVQHLDESLFRPLVEVLFEAKSPKGAQEKRIGKDPFDGTARALKADPLFQQYRMVSLIGNLRLRDPETNESSPLSIEQKRAIYEFLKVQSGKKSPTWLDVAEVIQIPRELLVGTATTTSDGERSSARPPVDAIESEFLKCKVKPVKTWWKKASLDDKRELVYLLSNASMAGIDTEGPATALLASLSDDEAEALGGMNIPLGRAAYSPASLRKLTEHMLTTGEDLSQARVSVFGVSADWVPPAPPIGEPVGNPAVDRVLKAVNRWLLLAEKKWGAPARVNIEHVRDGFKSKKVAAELDRQNQRRYEANQRIKQHIAADYGASGTVHNSDVRRFLALQRQSCECLYCGDSIDFVSAEMDHIVPRAGVGSTNTRDNLVAVCQRCNRSKSNRLFSEWAQHCGIPGVSVEKAIERVNFWLQDDGTTTKQFKEYQRSVISRLRRTNFDPPIDNRSIESVAWMARELAQRVRQHYGDMGQETKVDVFRGNITSAARKASGIEWNVPFYGKRGKTRVDRRHHAMDAATVAFLRPSVAKILVQRSNLRQVEFESGIQTDWKTYMGEDDAARAIYTKWLHQMEKITELFAGSVQSDSVPVFSNLRLQLGNSKAHADTIEKLVQKTVGDEWTQEQIDRAETPALWCALTRCPDFEWGEGLPENPEREIRVNGTWLSASDTIGIFPSASAYLKVSGGAVLLGDAIHHARLYRIHGKKKDTYGMVRVFAADLQRFRHQDLFSVELPPQSISMRTADTKVREAIRTGNAEYLTWLVTDDELKLDLSSQKKGQIAEFLEDFPGVNRWYVAGFYTKKQIRLRPIILAAEGMPESVKPGTGQIVAGRGWVPSPGVLLEKCNPIVIRRNALGEPRLESEAGLPVCRKLVE